MLDSLHNVRLIMTSTIEIKKVVDEHLNCFIRKKIHVEPYCVWDFLDFIKYNVIAPILAYDVVDTESQMWDDFDRNLSKIAKETFNRFYNYEQ